MTHLEPIPEFLAHTHLGPQQFFKSLSLWPVMVAGEAPASRVPYVSLAAAMKKRSVEVDEVDAGGSVPHVRVRNKGREAVLFLFGEEIRGAKQNRVANASFLVPARSEVVLDVSCVEAGRWQRQAGRRFSSSEEILSTSMRRGMSRRVTQFLAQGGGFRAGQGEVWRDIEDRVAWAGALSPTGAYSDYVDTRARDLTEIESAFRCVEQQVGFVACVGGRAVGLEVIGRPDVFAASFSGLVRAYAVDAIDAALVRESSVSTPSPTPSPPSSTSSTSKPMDGADSPEAFLAAVGAASCQRWPSLGAGEDLRLSGSQVEGCALVDGAVVHLTAYPAA